MIFNFSNDLFGDEAAFPKQLMITWAKSWSGPSKDWCYRNRLASRVQCEAYSVYMIRACPSCTQVGVYNNRTLLLFLLLFQPYNLKIRVVLDGDKASFGICEDSHWNVNHLKMRSESCSWHENLKDWSPLVFSQCNQHNRQSVGGEKRSGVFREISEKKNVDTEESDHRHKEGSWCNWPLQPGDIN